MKTLIRKNLPEAITAGLCLLLAAPGLWAQDAADEETSDGIEKIVVTAQRREQNLMDVPIAIDAISGDQILHEGIEDVQRLAEELPALVVGGQNSSTGGIQLSIRGLGSTSGDPAVGFYIDEVYQADSTGFVTQFLDVERVEVLKGPQGTLWGRNTTAGTVHYITKRPTLGAFDAEAYAEVGWYDSLDFSDYPIMKFGAALNVPMGETAAARVSAAYVDQDNYTFNTFLGGTQKNQEATTVRGDFLWEPTDNFTASFGISYIDDPHHNAFTTKTRVFEGSSTAYMLDLVSDVSLEDDTWKVSANNAPITDFEETGYRLGLDWELSDAVTLRSISAYKTLESNRFNDLDATRFTLVHNTGDIEHDWWSQELQFLYQTDDFNAIAGLYYFEEDSTLRSTTTANFAEYLPASCNNANTVYNPTFAAFCPIVNGFILPFMPLFNGGQPLVYDDFQPGGLWDTVITALGLGPFGLYASTVPVSGRGQDTDNNSFAVYAQGTYAWTDTLSLTLGLRYTNDEKDVTSYNWDSVQGYFFNPTASGIVKDKAVTPKVGLEWRPSDNALYYASYTEGFKSGALNIFAGLVEGSVPTVKPETISAWELGVKQSFADGLVVLDAAAYYYDYNDYQLTIQYLDGPDLVNLPSVDVKGIEAAIRLNPTEALVINASANYTDSSIKSDLVIQDPFDLSLPPENVRGQPLPRSPEFKSSLTADYTFFDVFGDSTLVVGGAWNYSDDFNHDLHGTFVGGGYSTLNANIRWVSGTGTWWANLYGRNLTNDEYQTFSIFADSIGEVQFWNPPRTIGLQVGYNFQ